MFRTRVPLSRPFYQFRQISQQVRTEAQQNNDRFKLENVFNVKNRVALITGGGSGIGLMATQALAVNGAKVYIVGRTAEKLNRVTELYSNNICGQIIPITADVTSKESIRGLVEEISSREKELHILVNNAGVASETLNTDAEGAGSLRKELFENENSRLEDWERAFRTNVPPLFFTTFGFLPLLEKGTASDSNWASTVINISSISGVIKKSQHHFAYNASKAAAVHLTKMLAHEISSSNVNIRVNNIAPGVFPSEMTAQSSDEKQKSSISKEKYEKKVPAGRPGRDEDMAGAILFAAANQYLYGQTVVVDGGYVLAA
ncbi:hypothetical protein ASPWEDRAFT_342466 [Aspergillus wentii DTO 134E9]|uniref:Uncharacterized protein n=1 Tax=Aspergillus wentii DTO 134E9 TaxID=1073089 RepID=A0A1L9RVA3_ASPWE|nr:uncharacterized protein ASPWEDRAFT_342466 [Aspergillus wentii DTO 134E9]KAI9928721.1 hypothetical protein MW887_001938 [Aspergillus wentii]OJJ38814.1 hypothetical protein ASPWEDRAFT_342466 [Aspergillus wentii DTO 134E9]